MNGPLSGKQHREYLKFAAKERREDAKAELEESRKQELHEIKLQAEAQKANQSLVHKEDTHAAKMEELGGPLSKSKIKVQPITVPETGTLGPSVGPTDTVPAMLTPGEAVIPKAAAQDPKNKPIIKQLVDEGRKGYAEGTAEVPKEESLYDKVVRKIKESVVGAPIPQLPGQIGVAQDALKDRKKVLDKQIDGYATGTVNVQDNIARIPVVGPKRVGRKGYAEGTDEVIPDPYDQWKYRQPVVGVESQLPEPVIKREVIPQPADVPGLQRELARNQASVPIPTNWKGVPLQSQAEALTAKMDQADIINSELQKAKGNKGSIVDEPAATEARRVADVASIQRELSKVKPGSEAHNILTAELAKSTGGVIPAKVSPYDVKVVSPDWLTNKNPASPNAAMRSQGAYPVIKGDQVVDFNAVPKPEAAPIPTLPDTGAGAGRGNSQAYDPVEIEGINKAAAQVAFDNSTAITEKTAEVNALPIKPEEKQSMMQSFISQIYGDKGIFNQRDLARFAVVAAGGLVTGGTVNGSLRYAARDTLANSDKRHTVEETERFKQQGMDQAEDKALRKSLLDQMYAPDKVEAYIKAKNDAKVSGGPIDSSILGEPKTTVKKTGAKPLVYTFSSGPLMGRQFPAEEVEHSTGKRKGDKEWYIQGVPVNDFAATFANSSPNLARLTSGAQLVPYEGGQHGPDAVQARYGKFNEEVSKDINGIYNAELGIPSNKGSKPRSGYPTEGEIALAARKFFNARGDYNPDDENQKNAMRSITAQATRKMLNTNSALDAKDRVNDITPYLAQEIIIGKSGVDSGAFMVGNRPMNAGLIADMDDKLKDKAYKANPKANPSEVEKDKAVMLRKMYKDWKELKPTNKKYEGGKTTSAFYQYVEDQLKKK